MRCLRITAFVVLLGAALMVGSHSLRAAQDDRSDTYTVVVTNRHNETIRLKRIGDGEAENPLVDLEPNESKTFNDIPFASDQVFIAWSNRRILGQSLKITRESMRNFSGIGLGVSAAGIIPNLMRR